MTPRMRQLLEMMKAGEELVWAGGDVWVGLERTNVEMVYRLMRRIWISEDNMQSGDEYMIFHINEWGLAALGSERWANCR